MAFRHCNSALFTCIHC